MEWPSFQSCQRPAFCRSRGLVHHVLRTPRRPFVIFRGSFIWVASLSDTGHGWITAIDGSSGKIRWRYRSLRPVAAAVTTTSGNVVFSGELTGDFIVLDAQSGEVLYRFNAGGPIGAGIITYQIDGTHYVSVMSGRPSGFWVDKNPSTPTVFLFALP